MSAQNTPGPLDRAISCCAELRAYGLVPTVPRLMRGVRGLRGLLRSQAVAAIAKATGSQA